MEAAPAPSDWDSPVPGATLSVSHPHPVKHKRLILGKAGSLLVLPKNWEGKWDLRFLQQHWMESFQGWPFLQKGKVKTLALWYRPTDHTRKTLSLLSCGPSGQMLSLSTAIPVSRHLPGKQNTFHSKMCYLVSGFIVRKLHPQHST